jgi:hypothetical protein
MKPGKYKFTLFRESTQMTGTITLTEETPFAVAVAQSARIIGHLWMNASAPPPIDQREPIQQANHEFAAFLDGATFERIT